MMSIWNNGACFSTKKKKQNNVIGVRINHKPINEYNFLTLRHNILMIVPWLNEILIKIPPINSHLNHKSIEMR